MEWKDPGGGGISKGYVTGRHIHPVEIQRYNGGRWVGGDTHEMELQGGSYKINI